MGIEQAFQELIDTMNKIDERQMREIDKLYEYFTTKLKEIKNDNSSRLHRNQ